jgi:lipid A disaccharide synthetase
MVCSLRRALELHLKIRLNTACILNYKMIPLKYTIIVVVLTIWSLSNILSHSQIFNEILLKYNKGHKTYAFE